MAIKNSGKYGDSDDFVPPVNIPKGASFKDMVALKGKPDIGDKINTQAFPWPEFRVHLKRVPRQHQIERVKASHLRLAKHEGSVTARGESGAMRAFLPLATRRGRFHKWRSLSSWHTSSLSAGASVSLRLISRASCTSPDSSGGWRILSTLFTDRWG